MPGQNKRRGRPDRKIVPIEGAPAAAGPAAVDAAVERVEASAYTIPTDLPESDGTLAWNKTTIVIAEAFCGGLRALGYSYSSPAAAELIQEVLAEAVRGKNAMDVSGCWTAMVAKVRNLGRRGIASTAIAAVDMALWNLKAQLLGVSLATLLGPVREEVPVYGSGGFTSYSLPQLQSQLGGWAALGIRMVKMKVGRDPQDDVQRVRAARAAIGPDVQLFVDANGAYNRKQALLFAQRFAEYGVNWFEEPVNAEDLEGLRLVRDRGPAGMDIAAGEYGYETGYFQRMLDAGAVDVLQADATRCGVTGLLHAATLCQARSLPFSTHTAPSIHAQLGCALPQVRHLEYFHDHVRIEELFFEGVPELRHGKLHPDLRQPGLGLRLRHSEVTRYAVA